MRPKNDANCNFDCNLEQIARASVGRNTVFTGVSIDVDASIEPVYESGVCACPVIGSSASGRRHRIAYRIRPMEIDDVTEVKRNLTTNGVAQRTGMAATTIVSWANKGWITCERDSAGRRLFDASVIDQVKKLAARHPRRAA